MADLGSLVEQEDREERYSRGYEAADEITTRRIERRQSESATVEAMERFGGGFVKALANAARHADLENYETLRDAFAKTWHRYAGEHARRVERKYD